MDKNPSNGKELQKAPKKRTSPPKGEDVLEFAAKLPEMDQTEVDLKMPQYPALAKAVDSMVSSMTSTVQKTIDADSEIATENREANKKLLDALMEDSRNLNFAPEERIDARNKALAVAGLDQDFRLERLSSNERRSNKTIGATLIGVGSLVAAFGGLLIYLDRRK